MLSILYSVAQTVLRLYFWAVLIAGIIQTLIAFGVLDTRNRMVWSIGDFFYRITEPALRRIRRYVPTIGGLDLSYLVLLLLIQVAEMLLSRIYAAIAYGNVQGLLL